MAQPGPVGLQALRLTGHVSAHSIVIFGGTFDPVHLGHLRAAEEIHEQLGMDEFRFLPCGQPPHREAPVASAAQRLEMLQLALAETTEFQVDERELHREGPSYMVDTLHSFRAEFPHSSLALVIGQDAANSLNRWYRWQEIPKLSHVVIMSRHGGSARYPDEVRAMVTSLRTERPASLKDAHSGKVLELEIDSLPVSASAIRGLVKAGRSVRFLVPAPVLKFIDQQDLYA